MGGNIMNISTDTLLTLLNFIMGIIRKIIDAGLLDEVL